MLRPLGERVTRKFIMEGLGCNHLGLASLNGGNEALCVSSYDAVYISQHHL